VTGPALTVPRARSAPGQCRGPGGRDNRAYFSPDSTLRAAASAPAWSWLAETGP
jgi:hypothetical protein